MPTYVQGASYDPRLLVFEFNCNMILRASQVKLVAKFVKAYREGKSLCHQVCESVRVCGWVWVHGWVCRCVGMRVCVCVCVYVYACCVTRPTFSKVRENTPNDLYMVFELGC